MDDNNKYLELIPSYLTGKMNPDKRIEFESELEKNQQLRDELAELKQLDFGLTVLDAINNGHIDSYLLVAYATNPNEIDSDMRREIEQHLESCDECREELAICRPAKSIKSKKHPRGFLASLQELIALPSAHWRAVYTAMVLLILAIPIIYLGQQFGEQTPLTATFSIIPAESRDLRSPNNIIIPSNVTHVRLEFVLPVLEGCTYDFELYDAEEKLVAFQGGNVSEDSFAFEVISSDLENGDYTLRVTEFDVGMQAGVVSEFWLSVNFDK